jgi:uncharacterized protein YjbI with pentapeptide repeats
LVVSVTVAIALMAVRRDADARTREATERRERQIREADAACERAAERQNLQLSLTMQADLRGIALADRDLRGFLLAGKDLTGADLQGANLAGADLQDSEGQVRGMTAGEILRQDRYMLVADVLSSRRTA